MKPFNMWEFLFRLLDLLVFGILIALIYYSPITPFVYIWLFTGVSVWGLYMVNRHKVVLKIGSTVYLRGLLYTVVLWPIAIFNNRNMKDKEK